MNQPSMADTIHWLPISDLRPHPDNPRVVMRDDVVEAIAANLDDGFDPAHALLVRANGGHFEIISGHHRHAACVKVGITSVPCWVREMDDESAYMALATSNSQGELSPLEIGLHALHKVGTSEGGRGKKGGLAEYARQVGRDESFIRQIRKAAEVAGKFGVNSELLDKTQHLAAIHALPQDAWPFVVDRMLTGGR